jgi:putative redox protein
MTRANATVGRVNYATTIQAGRHTLTVDESPEHGGQDVGPTPTDLYAAALASCTAITLRMYAERKQWPLETIQVSVETRKAADKSTSIERVLKLSGPLSDEQRTRLVDIAERTPVTLMVKNSIEVHTSLDKGGGGG